MKPLSLTLQLLDWSETKRGRKVLFEVLNDPESPSEVHPFAAFTARNGKVAGQYFAGVFVEFDPATGSPKEPATQLSVEPTAPPTQWDDLKLSQKAAMLCKDDMFQEWMVNEAGWPNANTEKGCREAICNPMGLTSRAQLDTNAQAAALFEEWLAEFFEWRNVKYYGVQITKPKSDW
jgi:hypothetical protein